MPSHSVVRFDAEYVIAPARRAINKVPMTRRSDGRIDSAAPLSPNTGRVGKAAARRYVCRRAYVYTNTVSK
ncbi:unnamed protein product, partial [Iphiclides podalirius]